MVWLILVLSVALTVRTSHVDDDSRIEYLADAAERFLFLRQDWGVLGINTAAHLPDVEGIPLRIGDKTYTKGLGHHANGEIVINLNAGYTRFEAEVGVQWLPEPHGSVIFKVFVDGKEKFNSGIMKRDTEAKPVSIPLDGAYELELIALDAGDGITCDCADWANARLVRSADRASVPPLPAMDIAPFARTVTSDPGRMDGARAGRIDEYHKEDVHLEAEALRDSDGNYELFTALDGRRCIGISWIERRHIRELALLFDQGSVAGNTDDVQVQYWVGGTPYQGKWVELKSQIETDGDRWVCRIDRESNPDILTGTWKVRWVLPESQRPEKVRGLQAFSPARYQLINLHIEVEPRVEYTMGIYNGEIISGPTVEPSQVRIRGKRSCAWQQERTILLFRFPEGAFGVALDDILANDAVYVEDFGLFIASEDADLTLAEYRERISDRRTILEEVRDRPDQTFEQALRVIHNPAQNMQPTLLSLACDNRKFIVERNGTVSFTGEYDKADDFVQNLQPYPCRLLPSFGSGRNGELTRYLDGGWLPAPVTEVRENGIVYRQRTFVAPATENMLVDRPAGASLDKPPIFVAQFTITNEKTEAAKMSLSLAFIADAGKNEPAVLSKETDASVIRASIGDRPIALANMESVTPLDILTDSGKITIKGTLQPGATAECAVYIPTWKWDKLGPCDGDGLFENMQGHWHGIMSEATQIEVPDPFLMDVIRASRVHCLIAARNEADGQRIAPWIGSVSYGPLESESNSIIRGMDLLGHDEFARQSLDYFIHRYSPTGMLTTGYTLMGMGWHLSTLGKHYALTDDGEWLKGHASEIMRACDWIVRQRQKTLDTPHGLETPERGLMPPGVMADWGAYAYYFCLNGYYYAGLRNTAQALLDINQPGADKLLAEAGEFRKDILRAYHYAQSRMPAYPLRDGTSVPGYPSALDRPGPTAGFFPGEDGNRSWCYDVEVGAHHLVPQGVLDPGAREVDWMMNHMEDVQFLADGWFDFPAARNHEDPFNFGGFSKVQPYYTRAGEIYAMRDDVKPFVRTYFNALSSLLNCENLSLQEHFNGVAAWNKTHETGYFLQQTRFMLVMEHGDDLYLAPLITSNWLKDGDVVAITKAPTLFGPVSYRITSEVDKGFIKARIDPPTRTQPKQIVLRLRHPDRHRIKSVAVNGRKHEDFDPGTGTIRLKPGTQALTVRANFAAK